MARRVRMPLFCFQGARHVDFDPLFPAALSDERAAVFYGEHFR